MSQDNSSTADVVYLSGFKIWTGTLGPDGKYLWAESIALKGDKILAVGSQESIRSLIGPSTKTVNAQDIASNKQPPFLITPGFIDSHLHFIWSGQTVTAIQLRGIKSKEEFIKKFEEFAKKLPAGKWITGGVWDHENWGGELPHHEWIDAVTPNNPVFCRRSDGHMGLANKLALEIAKITDATPNPTGGEIKRGSDGSATGVLKDNAMELVESSIPVTTEEEEEEATQAASDYVLRYGVTSVHHMGTFADLEAFRRVRARGGGVEGGLRTRIYAATPIQEYEKLWTYVEKNGRGDEWLKWGNLKGFTDGSLGSHTALMFDPYEDDQKKKEEDEEEEKCGHDHGDIGLIITPIKLLNEAALVSDRRRLHISLHAIGDRAISIALDAFEGASKDRDSEGGRGGGASSSRFRIEHAQHVRDQATMRRIASLGVIVSGQPYHLIDDGRWADKVIGARRSKLSWPFRSLADNGVKLAFGSDWYVAPPHVVEGIYAAVTRRTLDGKNDDNGGWVPEEKITVEEALVAYTQGGAYASFDEGVKGRLEAGLLADLVVLDTDLLGVAAEEPQRLWEAKVLRTIVGGRCLFERELE